MRSPKHFHGDDHVEAMRAIGTARSDPTPNGSGGPLLAFCLSANAVETATQRSSKRLTSIRPSRPVRPSFRRTKIDIALQRRISTARVGI
jgi:hypothetical protein